MGLWCAHAATAGDVWVRHVQAAACWLAFTCLGSIVLLYLATLLCCMLGLLTVLLQNRFLLYAYRQRYIMTSREVKRWDATSRSPVYASLSTTLKVCRRHTCSCNIAHDATLAHCAHNVQSFLMALVLAGRMKALHMVAHVWWRACVDGMHTPQLLTAVAVHRACPPSGPMVLSQPSRRHSLTNSLSMAPGGLLIWRQRAGLGSGWTSLRQSH